MLPTVALIGRPNVGKSTIFNRLVGKRKAVISDVPGTTRDIISDICEINDHSIFLVDTGGILKNKQGSSIEIGVQDQTELAISESDVIILVLDALVGMQNEDREILNKIRKSEKPFFVIVNKADNEKIELEIQSEFTKLGCEFVTTSSIHKMGFRKVENKIENLVKELSNNENIDNENPDSEDITISLVGKPNVGKSSIINSITGKKISLVSEIAGTTRDSIDTNIVYKDMKIKIVDTAGIRRKSKIVDRIEYYSYLRSIKSIHTSDIVVLITDSMNPITHYEKTILDTIEDLKKGCVLVVNKWDLVEKETDTMSEYKRYLKSAIPFLKWLPIVFTSAHENQRLEEILKEVVKIYGERSKKITTSVLNNFLEEAKMSHPPSALNSTKKHPKMYYITQTDVSPPSFKIFVNDSSIINQSYLRYLENRFRDEFGFYGTPIKFSLENRRKS